MIIRQNLADLDEFSLRACTVMHAFIGFCFRLFSISVRIAVSKGGCNYKKKYLISSQNLVNMTSAECDLCYLLLKNYYGPIVADVGKYLCSNGNQILGPIIIGTKLKPVLVKKALCVLIQHKIVTYRMIKKRTEYLFNMETCLQMLQVAKMIYSAKLLYGDPGELIIEEMLANGMSAMDKTVETVSKRLEGKADLTQVKSAFQNLIDSRLILLEPKVEEKILQKMEESKIDETTIGSKRKHSDDDTTLPQAKCAKYSENFYSINNHRFMQYFRDQIIIAGISNKFGSPSGEIVRTMLRISEVTTAPNAETTQPISCNEIKHALPASMDLSFQYVKEYLDIMMSNDGNFVQKTDESSSGAYVINLKKCMSEICVANVLSYIQVRYGSKSRRIFRLLMLKGHLEQKQVEDFAMIPSKEAKELLYKMWMENMLVLQEVPKTADHAPSRTYYLYNVNMKQVVRTLAHRCKKTLVNLFSRHEFEVKSNERLLDKRDRIDAIKATLQEAEQDQIEEIEDMLTQAEKDHLLKFRHCSNKLGKGQIQVANTIVIYDLYLKGFIN